MGEILPTEQDMITRMIYVVRPKDDLISALRNVLDTDGLEILSRPYVVMTQALPYEPYFESWGRKILKACKEQYLKEELVYGELSNPACRAAIDIDANDLEKSFDRWWQIEQANDYLEIEPSWFVP